jgi:hypothetical protein
MQRRAYPQLARAAGASILFSMTSWGLSPVAHRRVRTAWPWTWPSPFPCLAPGRSATHQCAYRQRPGRAGTKRPGEARRAERTAAWPRPVRAPRFWSVACAWPWRRGHRRRDQCLKERNYPRVTNRPARQVRANGCEDRGARPKKRPETGRPVAQPASCAGGFQLVVYPPRR